MELIRPLIVIGGSSETVYESSGAFQEFPQVKNLKFNKNGLHLFKAFNF